MKAEIDLKEQNARFIGTILNISKGFLIGAGALIPGLSGGTMAMITGVFEPLLEHGSFFYKHIKKTLLYVFPLSIGMLASVLSLSPLLAFISDSYPIFTKMLFCSICGISGLVFAKRYFIQNICKKTLICFCVGMIISFFIVLFQDKTMILHTTENSLSMITIGLFLALALILPAISFSYMLYFFGIYERFIGAINSLDFKFLIPLSFGIFIGCVLFAKALNMALNKHKDATYSIIFGFWVITFLKIIIK